MYTVHNSPGRWISALHRHAHIFINKSLKSYNIGSGQYIFLMELYECNGRKQDDLAKALNIDKGTTARALSNLEEHGYLTKEIDPADKRAHRVFLTNKAYEVKPYVHQTLLEWTNIITSGLSKDEVGITLEVLKKMAVNAVSNSNPQFD